MKLSWSEGISRPFGHLGASYLHLPSQSPSIVICYSDYISNPHVCVTSFPISKSLAKHLRFTEMRGPLRGFGDTGLMFRENGQIVVVSGPQWGGGLVTWWPGGILFLSFWPGLLPFLTCHPASESKYDIDLDPLKPLVSWHPFLGKQGDWVPTSIYSSILPHVRQCIARIRVHFTQSPQQKKKAKKTPDT